MKTTIQINGKIYDVHTGKVITAVNTSDMQPMTSKKANHINPPSTGTVIDGIGKINNTPPPNLAPVQVNNTNPGFQTKPLSNRVVNTTPSQTQRSTTLNRRFVKKPKPQNLIKQRSSPSKPQNPISHNTESIVPSRVEKSATGRGMLLKKIPDSRISRAIAIKRSSHVSKFNPLGTKPQPKLTNDLAVQSPPTKVNKPTNIAFAPTIPASHAAKGTTKPGKFVFETQLLRANSHREKPVKFKSKKHRFLLPAKITSITAAVFAILILATYFSYQKIPAISIKVAASKAGFDAKLPSNIPVGYSFKGPIQTDQNTVVMTYKSNSDDERQFKLVQKPSDWSSEALLSNYLIDTKYRYQIYRDKGLTVYVYNGSNATWVDKGVWFNVNSTTDSTLSSEQLLNIASSI